tara:strand:+ start:19 stop:465 length:447 start_codon:yes stop_codon:yes gene_type:complete
MKSLNEIMSSEIINRRLSNANKYDMPFHSNAKTDNGWKISIQGKSISDSVFLYERLNQYLDNNEIPFKLATKKRYDARNINKEQSQKAMTIYCVDGTHIMNLCEDVYSLIMDYKGWHDIKTPTRYKHYAGGVFYRNDRNETGEYIPAK